MQLLSPTTTWFEQPSSQKCEEAKRDSPRTVKVSTGVDNGATGELGRQHSQSQHGNHEKQLEGRTSQGRELRLEKPFGPDAACTAEPEPECNAQGRDYRPGVMDIRLLPRLKAVVRFVPATTLVMGC